MGRARRAVYRRRDRLRTAWSRRIQTADAAGHHWAPPSAAWTRCVQRRPTLAGDPASITPANWLFVVTGRSRDELDEPLHSAAAKALALNMPGTGWAIPGGSRLGESTIVACRNRNGCAPSYGLGIRGSVGHQRGALTTRRHDTSDNRAAKQSSRRRGYEHQS
jgi:hypothetical protein